jgi:hypothetical protein
MDFGQQLRGARGWTSAPLNNDQPLRGSGSVIQACTPGLA